MIWSITKKAGEYAGAVLLLGSLVWVLLGAAAEDYVMRATKPKFDVVEKSIDAERDRLTAHKYKMEGDMRDLASQRIQDNLRQIEIKTKVGTIEALQRTVMEDVKKLLERR